MPDWVFFIVFALLFFVEGIGCFMTGISFGYNKGHYEGFIHGYEEGKRMGEKYESEGILPADSND